MYVQSHKTIVLNSVNSIESKHEVTILSGLNEFVVKFFGPQGSKCFLHAACTYVLTHTFKKTWVLE